MLVLNSDSRAQVNRKDMTAQRPGAIAVESFDRGEKTTKLTTRPAVYNRRCAGTLGLHAVGARATRLIAGLDDR